MAEQTWPGSGVLCLTYAGIILRNLMRGRHLSISTAMSVLLGANICWQQTDLVFPPVALSVAVWMKETFISLMHLVSAAAVTNCFCYSSAEALQSCWECLLRSGGCSSWGLNWFFEAGFKSKSKRGAAECCQPQMTSSGKSCCWRDEEVQGGSRPSGAC